ncbi:hypothetical protein M0805_009426 [Coniferiporia weirii]|nr:hypothetical protein M0805_009426 [Coniferiporia weirii]
MSSESENAFHRVPPEIWSKVVLSLGRRELAALALVSKHTYPIANPLLYKTFEVSFCKCSQPYYDALARTIIGCPELAALVSTLLIDMKVPCRVKTASSAENLKSTSAWKKHLHMPLHMLQGYGQTGLIRTEEPKGYAEWNREAVQTLRESQLFETLTCLTGLKKIVIILGHFEHDPEVLSSLLNVFSKNDVLFNTHHLKIYDASLVKIPSLALLSQLRSLDLGYVGVADSALCTIVSRNAGTLEELRLNWIMETTQTQLFSNYSSPVLDELRVFATQGPQPVSADGLKRLLGDGQALEEIGLESLSVSSALEWAQVLIELGGNGTRKAREVRSVRFGAATGCRNFWDSVAHFLCHCGDRLESICINGSPRGPSGPFPSALLDYFLEHRQQSLSDLIIIWRDGVGLTPQFPPALESFSPSLNLLHVCLLFPSSGVDSLSSMISPFTKLRRLHLTFLKHTNTDVQSLLAHVKTVKCLSEDIEQKGPLFQEFLRSAIASHPDLEEVSWSIYDKFGFSVEGPKIIRESPCSETGEALTIGDNAGESQSQKSATTAYSLKDLGEEFRKHDNPGSLRHRCPVGSKKVLLSQKPGWREEMGNPFVETRRVCQYADFGAGGREPSQRRREL